MLPVSITSGFEHTWYALRDLATFHKGLTFTHLCMYTCTIFHGRERAQSTWIIHEVGAGLHLLINRQPVVTWAFSLSSQIRRRKSFRRLSLFLKEFDSNSSSRVLYELKRIDSFKIHILLKMIMIRFISQHWVRL